MSDVARIFIVDDEGALSEPLRRSLGKAGHRIVTARTGNEALHKFKPGFYELVIIDPCVAGMHGFHVLNTIVQQDREVTIIFHTAYPDLKKDFRSWIADMIVSKSEDPEEVVRKIGRFLSRRKKRGTKRQQKSSDNRELLI